MCRKLIVSLAAPVLLLGSCMSYAAKPVDLSHQSFSALKPFIQSPSLLRGAAATDKVEELNRSVDFNQTTHVRVQQMYSGVPVYGADSVVHIPNAGSAKRSLSNFASSADADKSTMNGTMYQDLGSDLLVKPEQVKGNEAQAINEAINLSHKDFNTVSEPQTKTSKLMVYIDKKDKKAHYAFLIKLYYDATLVTATYILDAQSFKSYKSWNDTKTFTAVEGGGFGGNENMGRLVYDGLSSHLSKLSIERDDIKKVCYLKNSEVTVKDARSHAVAQFKCDALNLDSQTYWAADFDTVNGGYSPSNDAIYAGSVVKEMYMDWVHVPMLVRNGKPMLLEMITHSPNLERPFNKDWENAVWYGNKVYLGDGAQTFYPLTSLGVVAHEISHGFTQQHSDLEYADQSGGLNESFSDMAAQAAETYTIGTNTWMIGSEIMKDKGTALRYMDTPSKDCVGVNDRNDCSIDNAKDYNDLMNVHGTSGVFNRLFYLLSQTWGVKKTFVVMVQANSNYWTNTSTFQEAACGVVKSAKDFHYDQDVLSAGLKEVGLTSKGC